jgi:CheY-like chemotaxis protein
MGTIDRARALTQQLLTFSKGGSPLRKVDRLFPFVQETAMFSLSGANVLCSFKIADDLWPCVFDRNQLGQVIDNIVINARQAMNNGGSLEISAENIVVKEGMHPLLQPGKFVKISLRDTGPGVPDDLLPKIFDPFYTTKEMGHGLGLAVCYSIIRKHDGSLEVESKPGEGCTFRILLPAASAQPDKKEVDQAPTHKGSGTIIVMDDEEALRKILASMLESLGYKVVRTTEGQHVLDWLYAHGSSCTDIAGFIFDLTVPGGMGGLETAAHLKKLGIVVPIFVTSGYADDPVMANPEKYGFAASISKPFRMAELSALLKRGFDKNKS